MGGSFGLGSDLEALAGGRAFPLVRCERISRHGAARETRDTFRLDFADGAIMKGRCLPSPAAAARLERIVERLDPTRFPRVLARLGSAVLEVWVPGEPLDRVPARPDHVRWAAETLAGVHRLGPPHPRPGKWMQARRALLSLHLGRLAEGGAIGEADAARLRDAAFANAPEEARFTLIHRDVCPENIVLDPTGRLHCVDNATARGGAAEEDLARTCYRWPLEGPACVEFLAAYGRGRDADAFVRHRRFWMIAALAHASWIRHSRAYARADVPVRRLLAELRADPREPCCASPTAPS